MRIHNQELRALQDENQRLRAVVDTKQRGMEQTETTLQPNLRGGNPGEAPGVPGLCEGQGGELCVGPPQDPDVSVGNAARVREV